MKNKVLMHTCCAPCSVYCIDSLRKEGIEPTLFWYNPNIHPYIEYKTRRDCLKDYAAKISAEIIIKKITDWTNFAVTWFKTFQTVASIIVTLSAFPRRSDMPPPTDMMLLLPPS